MKQFFTKLITRELSSFRTRSVTYKLSETTGWGILGGTCLATHDLVNNPDVKHSVHLYFHGGKNMWGCEYERWSKYTIIPREDYYGSLHQMMAKFEHLTRQRLEEVTWCQLGAGISHHSAEGIRGGTLADPRNPWELEEGAIYVAGTDKRYRAVRVGKGPFTYMELKPTSAPADYPETFDPSLMMELLIKKGGRTQFKLVEPAPKPDVAQEAADVGTADQHPCVDNDAPTS